MGASSRLRTLQYVPYLEMAGFLVIVAGLFDDACLMARYASQVSSSPIRLSIGS